MQMRCSHHPKIYQKKCLEFLISFFILFCVPYERRIFSLFLFPLSFSFVLNSSSQFMKVKSFRIQNSVGTCVLQISVFHMMFQIFYPRHLERYLLISLFSVVSVSIENSEHEARRNQIFKRECHSSTGAPKNFV